MTRRRGVRRRQRTVATFSVATRSLAAAARRRGGRESRVPEATVAACRSRRAAFRLARITLNLKINRSNATTSDRPSPPTFPRSIAQVTVGENEAGESAIRRFRRAVMNSGHINETRRRRYFENPQDIKKRKQSTPRKKKGAKPRTAAQALAEKEQAAMNPRERRGGFGNANNGGEGRR